MWRSVLSGAGFSLWGLYLKDQTPQAEARATELSEFRGCSILAELQSIAPAAQLLKKSAK
jgi:hypothetical protein